MSTMNRSLAELYLSGKITYEDALTHATDVRDFKAYMAQISGKEK